MEFNERLISANATHTRYIIHQGGTGSGKTYSTLQYLLLYALKHKGSVISVVAETLPHLKRGALRDFKNILQAEEWQYEFTENKTEHTFTIGSSLIEFFSADAEAKLRGARRDILFINECNNVDYESFQQLDVRTRHQTILDYNPVCRFWVHDKLIPSLTAADHLFVKSTYVDNQQLGPEEKRNIERRRQNTNWWKVYGEGEIGMSEGQVFTNWAICTELRVENGELKVGNEELKIESGKLKMEQKDGLLEESNSQFSTFHSQLPSQLPGTLLGYGIDFGFTHSPTAIVQVNEYEGDLYLHELLYRSGIQNDELLEFVQKHIDMNALAVADSAEPKTIDYLFRKGWVGLKPAAKGNDSLLHGINLLLDRKLNVTASSLNLIKELRQYMWDTNKDGAFVRKPIKEFDHAIDAIRYFYSYPKQKKLVFA